MKTELRRLLADAGYARALSAAVWERVVVVNNYGSVPLPQGISRDFAQKGFKLLLLDDSGRPTHFARCGAVSDEVLEREGHILEVLCQIPELERSIPKTRSVTSDVLRVQLNSYIPGRLYQQFVGRRSANHWGRDVREILEVRRRLSAYATERLPELLRGGPHINPAEEAVPHLRLLRSAGLEGGDVSAIEVALVSGGELPRVLQHGDLWPGNVLRHDDAWWLIDFAEFAQVQVPMYDVFHMLQSNPGRRDARTRRAWLSLGVGAIEDQWTAAARSVVQAQATRLNYSPVQVGAMLVYYLVHISAYRLREGVPRQFGDAYIRELLRVAALLRRGVDVGRLVRLIPTPG